MSFRISNFVQRKHPLCLTVPMASAFLKLLSLFKDLTISLTFVNIFESSSAINSVCYPFVMSFQSIGLFRKLQTFITKTCPCNVYPIEPHFYIVKLGFAGVYLIFLLLIQNIDCGNSLEPPRRGGSNVYPQSMF